MDDKKFAQQEKTGWAINLTVFLAFVAAMLYTLYQIEFVQVFLSLSLENQLALGVALFFFLFGAYLIAEKIANLYTKRLL